MAKEDKKPEQTQYKKCAQEKLYRDYDEFLLSNYDRLVVEYGLSSSPDEKIPYYIVLER